MTCHHDNYIEKLLMIFGDYASLTLLVRLHAVLVRVVKSESNSQIDE